MSSQAKLDVNVTCGICKKVFRDPKLLPCLHSFCEKCIESELSNLGIKPWTCPICNTEVEIPNGDTSSLVTNFWLESMARIHELRSEPNEKQICSFCSLAGSYLRAVSVCVTCGDLLCTECAMKRHTFTTQTRCHKVVSLCDVKSGKFSNEIRTQQPILCPIHKEEPLRYFCQSCDVPVCRDCIVLGHKDHDYLLPMEAKCIKEQEIKELLESIKCKMDLIQIVKGDISKSKEELMDKERLLRQEIFLRSDSMISKIMILRKALENELSTALTPIKETIQLAEEKLKQDLSVFQDTLLSSENILKFGTDIEFLSAQKVIKSHLLNLKRSETRSIWQIPRCSMPTLHIESKDPEFALLYKEKSANEEENMCRIEGITTAISSNAQCPSLPRLETYRKDELPAVEVDDTQLTSPTQTLQGEEEKCKEENLKNEEESNTKHEKNIVQQGMPALQEAPFKITFLATYILKNKKDYFLPYCSSLAWLNDNQLVVADAHNEKIKVLINRNEVARQRTVRGCMTLVANSTYIACKLKNGEMQVFDHNLNLKCSFYDVSVILGCCSNAEALSWISGAKVIQTTGSLHNLRKMTITDEHGQPMKFGCPMFATALPNGKFVISDFDSKNILFLNEKARLVRSEMLIQGAITADFESNIFIVDSLTGKLYIKEFLGATRHTLKIQKCSLGPQCIALSRQRILSIAFEEKLSFFEIK